MHKRLVLWPHGSTIEGPPKPWQMDPHQLKFYLWHIFWHHIRYSIWHRFWHSVWHINYDIPSGMLCRILVCSDLLSGIVSHDIWSILSHDIWYIIYIYICIQLYICICVYCGIFRHILTFYLAFFVSFYATSAAPPGSKVPTRDPWQMGNSTYFGLETTLIYRLEVVTFHSYGKLP